MAAKLSAKREMRNRYWTLYTGILLASNPKVVPKSGLISKSFEQKLDFIMAGASLEYRLACKAIHDVLIKEWDPIGVGDEPMAQDEYDSYIPVIYRLLCEGVDDLTIARHLEQIETKQIGLSSSGDRNIQIARRLRETVCAE